jgi:energy-coupling factor transport system ATP-binding protein
MIEFESVSFGYGGGRTVSNISFRLEKGEFAAVVGENGAGKTTISKLCNGLLKPAQGRVTVNGMDTKATRVSRIARSVGFLFQNPDRQICRNTVRDEILFGLTLTVDDPAERARRLEKTLSEFGFDPDRNPFALSRGERQRLALASLMACEPDVMILDEPTTGLDYRECMEVMERIAERNRAGATVLMVCHDMEVVQDFATRVLVVAGGALIGDGPTGDIMTDAALLKRASVAPAQIPQLALKFGDMFSGVFTIGQMADAIEGRVK